jgi:hypothetical protein
MKHLWVCSLFVFGVNAKDLAYADNVIGGVTVLTDRVCRYNKELLEAYATNDKKETAFACYLVIDDKIFFILKDDSVRMMLKKQFKLMKGFV